MVGKTLEEVHPRLDSMLNRESRLVRHLPLVQSLDVLEGIPLAPAENELWAIGIHWSREGSIGVLA
jgi:hypothetical protein